MNTSASKYTCRRTRDVTFGALYNICFFICSSFDLGKVTIRNVRSEEAGKIWEWTESVEWNETLQDIQLYCDIYPEGFLVAEMDGNIIGEIRVVL
jgi:hypothetical protein